MFNFTANKGFLLLLILAFANNVKAEIKFLKPDESHKAITKINLESITHPIATISDEKMQQLIKGCCPEDIYPIFEPDNQQWRKYFATNCKALLKTPALNGEFDYIYSQKINKPKLEYAFFKGTTHAEKLIVLTTGGFYDKHFALPYIILLNKLLGFSCLIADYRGHENSWDETKTDNILYRMRDPKRACGIDSSEFTFGEKEGWDFYHLIMKIKGLHPEIQEFHSLGICFGAIVSARMQNLYLKIHGQNLFNSMALISPLPSAHDLIVNVLNDSRALSKFVSQKTLAKINAWPFLKISRFISKLPIIENFLTWGLKSYLQINKFNSFNEFEKLDLPLLCIASSDSDYIVTKEMALKVFNNIPAKQKLLLWSFGVEHLFNWREETTQLVVVLQHFFLHSQEALQNPATFSQPNFVLPNLDNLSLPNTDHLPVQ